VFLVVVRLDCRYKLPARYDDVLEVRVRVGRATRVKIEHEYDVFRVVGDINPATLQGGAAADLLMSAATTLGCVDAHARIRELPAWLASIDP
jgi:acyl-CoA thioester hydrolase